MASPRNSVVDVDAAAAAASPPADAGGDGMLCQYPSKKCQGVRVRKRDGGLHRFCDYHRSIANRNQRRADRRRRHKKEVKMITPFRRPIPPQQPPMLLPSMVAFHHHHGYSAEVMPRMDARVVWPTLTVFSRGDGPVTMMMLRQAWAAVVGTIVMMNEALARPALAKVLSFNLRTSLAPDPCEIGGCWEDRRWRAKMLIERHGPDFIGTQETSDVQMAFLHDEVDYASFGECAGPCELHERNAILFDSRRWRLLTGSTFSLSETPDAIPASAWGMKYLRAAVWGRFEDKQSGNVMCVFNTHFDEIVGHEECAVLVATKIREYCRDGDTVVLMGDLNAVPSEKAMRYLSGEVELNGSHTPVKLYDALTVGGAGGSTFEQDGKYDGVLGPSAVKFDWIYTRQDDHTCLKHADILMDTFDGFAPSDHMVPMVTFCIGKGCQNCLNS
ncbi:TPA: hypothetical protein N0F65_000526 [Lagenidium giganteum]|uniref:Endonuclease/exonuclease/phosphatase domain-containing protein n=1 Tax=Lagenidium giganteum TaxID=4803 RepID=A0AAV2YZ93_9STRA|nr:TPA: hypothetical protein N0F65_000526 [Lagenidium giganteum]